MTKATPRVFSGMQPTGNLHLGNYLGAMVNWIAMAQSHESIYCVVDMHAITVWQDPRELHKAIRDVTAAYVACGLDPKNPSSSTRAKSAPMRNWVGFSIAWQGLAG